jgi:eukaryotic-like serine/threonine-protein kinase
MTGIERLSTALAGRYSIERELGAGGTATVYLAADLKHDRKVALKVLKPELSAVLGADRFLVEIKTTAALQHPHILPLFDSGTAHGFLYYVMPFIDGETLRSKLDRETQLGIDESVAIAASVADALDYAHRHGVIHRDIKPENILLHDGRPVIADFGIALAVSAAAGGRMTETGLSLGTPYYMSPEQATAKKEISGRSDIYSLASVLYEMLTGEPPHMGNSAQQIIMKIITEEVQPVARLRKSVPPNVAAAVAKALEKLPADRFDSAAAFAQALRDARFATAHAANDQMPPSQQRAWLRDRRSLTALSLTGIALVALGAAILGKNEQSGSIGPDDVVRATLSLGDSVAVRAIGNIRVAISPDGKRIAFIGASSLDYALWVRDFSHTRARQLPNTEGAFAPFFSPDGESIGFFTASGSRTMMKAIDVTSGVVRTVVEDSVAQWGGADWADDGNIYFTDAAYGLSRISAEGGAIKRIARADSAQGYFELDYPDVLPGSHFATATIWRNTSALRIGLIDLDKGTVTDLMPGSYARYVPPDLLAVGTPDGRILVAPFDPRKGKLTRSPSVVLADVQSEWESNTVQFAVSFNGTLLYQTAVGLRSGLVWVDRKGQQTFIDSTLTDVTPNAALSPDASQVAVTRSESSTSTQLWIKHLATGTLSRLSFDFTHADRPVWTPDGKAIAFLGQRDDRRTAWVRPANGNGTAQPAVPGSIPLDEILYDPTGRYTLLRTEGAGVIAGGRKLMVLRNGVDTIPQLLIKSPYDHYAMSISPDGKWLAFTSTESGTPEVHVRPFPNVDAARYVISQGGGDASLWSRNGRELFFRGPHGQMFAVPVTTGSRFTHGKPQLLFAGNGLGVQFFYRSYDVHPDGKRFLMVRIGGDDTGVLDVVFNWRSEVRRQLRTPN